MAPKSTKKTQPVVEEAVEEYDDTMATEAGPEPEAEAEAEEAEQEPAKKPSRKGARKPSRKLELATSVKEFKDFMLSMRTKRKTASMIPRGGENPEWEEERLATKAVGYPVLLRDAKASWFYDIHNMQNRVRLTGGQIVLRVNKKGDATEAVVLPRASAAATRLILDIAMTQVSRFMRASQEYVSASRRKNLAARDVHMAQRRFRSSYVIARLASRSAE